MPTTEVPTSTPERPPEPPPYRKRSRYEDLDAHEFFHLIEEYEDERARARLREAIWISIIFYMLLGWFLLYGIRFLPSQAHVIDPSMALKNRTYLDLPPDLQKIIKPRPTNITSDKNRVAQSKNPAIDKKTLDQLKAMRRPAPEPPAPQPPAPQPEPVQQQPPPQKPTQPLPQNPQSTVEAPTPAKPNFQTPSLSPGEAISKAARDAARGDQGTGDYGDDGQHAGAKAGAEILSDTLGVDFGPYMQHIIHETQRTWDPLVPEAARPPLLKRGIVQIQFIIMPDGRVKSMRLIGPSGDVSLDRAAWGAITGSNYPQLPKAFKGPYLELRFGFFYNEKPGVE